VLVGCEQRSWRSLRRLRLRHDGSDPLQSTPEGKMAVVVLVERFDEVQPGCGQGRCDLGMADSGPANDINCLAQQVVAVRNSPYCAIVFNRSKRTCHGPELRNDADRRGREGLTRKPLWRDWSE
jgi:hypothetical protein